MQRNVGCLAKRATDEQRRKNLAEKSPAFRLGIVQYVDNRLLSLEDRVTVTYFLHTISMAAVFPPRCAASYWKCLVL